MARYTLSGLVGMYAISQGLIFSAEETLEQMLPGEQRCSEVARAILQQSHPNSPLALKYCSDADLLTNIRRPHPSSSSSTSSSSSSDFSASDPSSWSSDASSDSADGSSSRSRPSAASSKRQWHSAGKDQDDTDVISEDDSSSSNQPLLRWAPKPPPAAVSRRAEVAERNESREAEKKAPLPWRHVEWDDDGTEKHAPERPIRGARDRSRSFQENPNEPPRRERRSKNRRQDGENGSSDIE
ncbi:MAG: hypothetical protein Q8P67_03200 [archaeon]|nr:hypothetical protein [archaeon]